LIPNERYEKILREGKRVDWHGDMVPEDLITKSVELWASMIIDELHLLEGTLSDLKGVAKEKRQHYVNGLWNNVKHAPYTLNGDVYMKKKRRIEEELKEKETPKKTTRRRKTATKKTTKKTTNKETTTNAKPTSSKTGTKNSGAIFGKNT
jgi:hypothetical protein